MSATRANEVPASEMRADLRTQFLAQKTHLISELAEAIDNQFNNIMMSVTSYAELELRKASGSEKRSLEQLLRNAGQATNLIQKLLDFSRVRTTSSELLDVNKTISGISGLLQQLAGEKIEVSIELQPQLARISADRIELEQLLLSLAVHARNAMSGEGKLTVTTQSAELEQNGSSRGKQYVMVSVCDSGGRTDNKASAPPPDLRISLTLSAIQRMVQEAQGRTRISSEPGEGTKFSIYFPATEEGTETIEVVDGGTSVSTKTILVVEDDDAVRVPATEFLMMEGFKVMQARTGAEAINIVRQNRSSLHLLITDLMMPAMNGREVARELSTSHPHLKVLYMSGDASEAAALDPVVDAVLQKPFPLHKLNETIRQLLSD